MARGRIQRRAHRDESAIDQPRPQIAGASFRLRRVRNHGPAYTALGAHFRLAEWPHRNRTCPGKVPAILHRLSSPVVAGGIWPSRAGFFLPVLARAIWPSRTSLPLPVMAGPDPAIYRHPVVMLDVTRNGCKLVQPGRAMWKLWIIIEVNHGSTTDTSRRDFARRA